MLTLRIEINNHVKLLELKAVRVSPTNKEMTVGEMCTYSIYLNKKFVGKVVHPFGDGISLGKKMLDHYEFYVEMMAEVEYEKSLLEE